MTKQQELYEKLREHYYTLFPEEKKLEFGCRVNYLDFRGRIHKGYYYYGEEAMTGKPVLGSGKYDTVVVEKDCYTLIPGGKPLTLQMILRMLELKTTMMQYDCIGRRLNMVFIKDGMQLREPLKIDLSKEPKDWPVETLQSLVDLIIE